MQYMIKCNDNNMPLPYGSFITHIMMLYGINLINKASIMLRWNNNFGKKTMKTLNIFEVNVIWQLGRLDNDHEERDKDLPLPKQHVEGGQLETSISHDVHMLTQI